MAKRRSAHYAMAYTLYNSEMYVDQWKKVLALYSDNGDLLCILKNTQYDDHKLSIFKADGSVETFSLQNTGFELGTMAKNIDTSFKMYLFLRDYIPFEIEKSRSGYSTALLLHQYFTHTRVGAMRHGGFFALKDEQKGVEKIEKALEKLEAANVVYSECYDLAPYEPMDSCIWEDYGSEAAFWEANI